MEAHYGKSAEEVIALLGLAPHPEGGYYKETFRSPNTITTSSTSSSQSQSQSSNTERAACTAIYFLLAEGQRSHWHRVDAVETWLWHAGKLFLFYLPLFYDVPYIFKKQRFWLVLYCLALILSGY
jgi:predicted cupin superfamily sugar epimerase